MRVCQCGARKSAVGLTQPRLKFEGKITLLLSANFYFSVEKVEKCAVERVRPVLFNGYGINYRVGILGAEHFRFILSKKTRRGFGR